MPNLVGGGVGLESGKYLSNFTLLLYSSIIWVYLYFIEYIVLLKCNNCTLITFKGKNTFYSLHLCLNLQYP